MYPFGTEHDKDSLITSSGGCASVFLTASSAPGKPLTNPFDPGARFSVTVLVTPNKWLIFLSFYSIP